MAKNQKESKKVSVKKLPGVFRKSYKEKKFKKRILKFLYIKEYRDFAEKIFTKDNNGNYSLQGSEYTIQEARRMKAVAKSLKQNRGFISVGKLIFLVIILAAVFLFNYLFKDTIITNLAEESLEKVFGAKAEFSGLKFRPESAGLSFGSLMVANKSEPMKNLFELGPSEIKLNMAELLKGKYIIENFECRDIRWDTERKTSGALPSTTAAEKKEEKTEEAEKTEPGEEPAFSFDLAAIDVNSILESQKGNLETVKQIEAATTEVSGLKDKWTGEVGSYQQELTGLINTAKRLSTTNLGSITTVAAAQSLYTEVQSAYSQVTTMKTKIANTQNSFTGDLKTVESRARGLTGAFETDYKYLKSFIDLPDQEKQAIVASLADKYLEEKLGVFYTYGIKVLDYAKQMELKSASKEEKPKKGKGYYIHFPGKTYPQFLLENAAFSFGEESSGKYLKLSIQNLTSDPALTAKPVTFGVTNVDNLGKLIFQGEINTRAGSEIPFSMNFRMEDYPLELTEGMEVLGVKSLKCTYDFTTDFSIGAQEQIKGTVVLKLSNLTMELKEATNIVTKELSKILKSIKGFSVDASYDILDQGKKVAIHASSDLDDIIMNRVGTLIKDTVKEAEKRIRTAFDGFIKDKLKGHTELYTAFRDIQLIIAGDLSSVQQYETMLKNKQQEITGKIAAIEQAVIDAAKQKATEAASDAVNKVTDKIKLPF